MRPFNELFCKQRGNQLLIKNKTSREILGIMFPSHMGFNELLVSLQYPLGVGRKLNQDHEPPALFK